jgi:Zn-dependent peptidase ImmA (M78 family)
VCVAKHNVPGDRQRFTVAHELGHLTLHGDVPAPRTSADAARLERQANRFASAFLGPADALMASLEEAGGKVTLNALAHVKATWGISIKGLVGRYRSLGAIDDDHARSLYKQISARKWTIDEPVHVPTESAQWFERTLRLKANSDDLASAARVLADSIGGSTADLLSFADWGAAMPAQVIDITERRRS